MYARLRQKIAVSTTSTVTSNGTGTIGLSVLMKDIAKVISGLATSTADLNPAIWDLVNSEIVYTGPTGWSEYQTTYLTTSTNIPADAVNNTIYLRARSQNTAKSGNSIYKYFGIGHNFNGTTPASWSTWNIIPPYNVTEVTGNPAVNFRTITILSGSVGERNPFTGNILSEYVIYANQTGVFVSATLIGSSATQPGKVVMFLEHPATVLNSVYDLPNQVWWELSTYASGAISTATGTGASFVSAAAAYQAANPGYLYSTGTNQDPLISATSNGSNINAAFAYSTVPGGTGWTSLWGTPASQLSTLKPTTFGGMANTVDASGATVAIPVLPLMHWPAWDSVWDLSSLTGIYATKSALGSNGDTITINGNPYAYVNATTMGYLIPRR